MGPVERDMSNGENKAGDGRALSVRWTRYAKGLGVHASSEIVVPVDGARRFMSTVGVDTEVNFSGSVVFQVFDGTRKLADSGRLTGGAAKDLSVDVTGVKQLRLVVTDAGDGSVSDHGDWANARSPGER